MRGMQHHVPTESAGLAKPWRRPRLHASVTRRPSGGILSLPPGTVTGAPADPHYRIFGAELFSTFIYCHCRGAAALGATMGVTDWVSQINLL